MIQGGGFTPNLDKKPGVRAPILNEWQNGLKNKRGTIAMARLGGQADSATAQFFINVVDNAGLDQARDGAAYAVFGKVVEGMDTIDKIKDTPVQSHAKYSGGKVVPVEPVIIESVKVLDQVNREQLGKLMEDSKKQIVEKNEKKGKELENYIQDVELKFGKKIEKTASGLMYIVIKNGEGPSPKPSDRVVVHYEGTFLDGKKFDSSYDRNEPSTFRLDQVIKGWTEGVGMMKVGGKRLLIVPGDLAYGPRGRGSIPPNATLVFTVELLDIK
jgi:FKBP-type peptidyl-prolyl cis-trans isomerase FkpA